MTLSVDQITDTIDITTVKNTVEVTSVGPQGPAGSGSTAGVLLKINNLSDVNDVDTSRYNIRVPVLREARAVATTNIASLSGTTTIDSVALVAGDRVLLTAQTTGSQNGPWVIQTGAWTRPLDYPSGGIFISRLVPICGGTLVNQGLWQLKSNTNITIDTTATTWSNISWIRQATAIGYAATITPILPTVGDAIYNVGTLTGNLTINSPSGSPADGEIIRFRFTQDATGGRTITWNAIFVFGTDITTSMVPTVASTSWEMLFAYTAANLTWRCLALARGF